MLITAPECFCAGLIDVIAAVHFSGHRNYNVINKSTEENVTLAIRAAIAGAATSPGSQVEKNLML